MPSTKTWKIHLFDGTSGSLIGFEMNKSVSFGSVSIWNKNVRLFIRVFSSYNDLHHLHRRLCRTRCFRMRRMYRTTLCPWCHLLHYTQYYIQYVTYIFPNSGQKWWKGSDHGPLLSIDLSKFLMKMFPWPDFRSDGSRWLHMIRIGLP